MVNFERSVMSRNRHYDIKMDNLTVPEQLQSAYRIPPAKQNSYIVFKRGESLFAVNSAQLIRVLQFDQIPSADMVLSSREAYGTLHDFPLPLIDVAYVMGAVPSIAKIKSMFLAVQVAPDATVVYIAIDEILSMQYISTEVYEEMLDEIIGGTVHYEHHHVPLVDVSGVVDWVTNNQSSHLSKLQAIPSKVAAIKAKTKYRSVENETDFLDQANAVIEKYGITSDTSSYNERIVHDVCLVGGVGRVGLPLGLTFASAGKKIALYDTNKDSVKLVANGEMPFEEAGAQEVLTKVLNRGLVVTDDISIISKSYFVIVVIETPVDAHLNPCFASFNKIIDEIAEYIDDDQHLILRSTVYPGTTDKIQRYLASKGKRPRISFCPERMLQSKAMYEIPQLGQIVASSNPVASKEVTELFQSVTKDIVALSPQEAELGKIYANVWRYLQFAVSNQFYQIALNHDLDYYRIYDAITKNYPRLDNMPTAGFAAGPCLFKDTMQLAAYSDNDFFLGHAAMLVNEGIPKTIVGRLKEKYPLDEMVVGILGMAFKGNCDDQRDSLSYKLKNLLALNAQRVICSDEYCKDETMTEPLTLIADADIIILAAPHDAYKSLQIDSDKIVVDIWNFYGNGGLF